MIYWLMREIESNLLAMKRMENKWPPVFILGAPRSGTTVAYLYLVNYIRSAYFPNIARKYPQAVIFSTWWGKRFHKYEGTFNNEFGEVRGPMAPSDGWEIFHRWFPRYDLSQPVNKKRLHELKTLVRWMEKIFHGPFINKNNNNTPRIQELKELFPRAIFIHITRNFRDTVLSIMEARHRHNVPDNEWWSTTAPNFYDADFSSPLERTVCQVWDVNRHIETELHDIPEERKFKISYKDFCEQPQKLLDWVKDTLAGFNAPLKMGPLYSISGAAPEIKVRPRKESPSLEADNHIYAILEKFRRNQNNMLRHHKTDVKDILKDVY